MKKYFHELSQEEVDKLITDNVKLSFILDNFLHPDWCGYPEALSMDLGCWSLCDITKNGIRIKISEDFCKNCDCFKQSMLKLP